MDAKDAKKLRLKHNVVKSNQYTTYMLVIFKVD